MDMRGYSHAQSPTEVSFPIPARVYSLLPPAPGAMLLQGSLLHGSRYAPHIQLCTGGAGVGNSLLSRSVRGNTHADPYLSHFIRVFVCNYYHGSFYAPGARG